MSTEKKNKDTSKLGRNKGGKENSKPQWFTEGHIGEVEVNLASTDKCTITIDPSAPFKVEYQEKKPDLIWGAIIYPLLQTVLFWL